MEAQEKQTPKSAKLNHFLAMAMYYGSIAFAAYFVLCRQLDNALACGGLAVLGHDGLHGQSG